MVPARGRLLGLFGPIEGALLGAVISHWLAPNGKDSKRAVCLLFLSGALAYGLTSGLWWNQFANDLTDEFRAPSAEALMMQLVAQNKDARSHPETAEDMRRLQAAFSSDPERIQEISARVSLPGYLVFRCYGLSNAAKIRDKQLIAIGLWCGELLLAGLAAVWFGRAREPLECSGLTERL